MKTYFSPHGNANRGPNFNQDLRSFGRSSFCLDAGLGKRRRSGSTT